MCAAKIHIAIAGAKLQISVRVAVAMATVQSLIPGLHDDVLQRVASAYFVARVLICKYNHLRHIPPAAIPNTEYLGGMVIYGVRI